MRRQLISVLFTCVCAVVGVRPSLAQDQDVVFVHGFRSSGASWEDTATRLAQDLAISKHVPTLVWQNQFVDQTPELNGKTTAAVSPIMVGHSNGGLLSRNLSRTRPVDGILTIGTPHGGVPLIYNAYRIGVTHSEILELIDDIWDEIDFIGSTVWWIIDLIKGGLSLMFEYSFGSMIEILTKWAVQTAIPVTTDMQPGSQSIRTLNASSNLTREAAEIPVRAGIIVETANFFEAGLVRSFAPDSADAVNFYMELASVGLASWAIYLEINGGPGTGYLAELLWKAADWLMDRFDMVYCEMASTPWPIRECHVSDTVVPWWSQRYPGAIELWGYGPGHIQEKQQRAWFDQVLTTYFQVPRRGGPPPPPPPPPGECAFSVSRATIDVASSGGTEVIDVSASRGDCSWTSTSHASWITVQPPGSGQGSGSVAIVISENNGPTARSGSLTVAGKTVIVNQPGEGCAFTLSPPNATVGQAQSTQTVTITAASSSCAWTAASNSPWLTITSGYAGTGDGTVQYSVAANTTTADRTGTLSIAGRTFTVTQRANGAPVVVITRPTSEALFARGESIPIEATATDADGTVTRVDFSADGTLLGTDTTAPYTFTWTGAASGRHTITATAYDNLGTAGSTSISIGVNSLDSITVTPSSIQAGQSATITVTGENPCGAVGIEFGDGRVQVFPITGLPFSHTTTWAAAGQMTVRATGHGNCVGTVTTTITVAGNSAPTVSLTAPADGARYLAPATVTLSATASDSDGTIARVEFFSGPFLIGTATSAPYTVQWTNIGAGSYTITAQATDNAGAVGTSAVRAITVSDVGAITVDPASPIQGQPATVTVTGSSSCGALQIDYGDGTAVTYALSGLPTSRVHTWTTPGAKTVVATGHGNCIGQVSTTITVIGNAAPTVSLTAPAHGATFAAPATIGLAANAADSDGTIARVEFYAGSSLLGTDSTAPYTFSWANVSDGSYILTAQAVDNLGARTTSAAATVTVTRRVTGVMVSPSPVVTGQQATVTVLGSPVCGAVEINYGDGTSQTYAITGFPYSQAHVWTSAGSKTITATGHGDCGGQASTVLTVNSNPPPSVSLTAPASGSVYTTGTAVVVSANASDAHGIATVEFFAGSTLIGTDSTAPYSITWAVPSGTHSLTARATDPYGASATSAAVSITARDVQGVSVSPAPLTAGAVGTVTVTGSTSCGAVTIDYGDGTAITYAITGLPISRTHTWATGGWKTVTATGQSSCLGQATASVYINAPPSIVLTSPVNGNTYDGPASVPLAANASDADGSIAYVNFYANGVLLATDTAAPYSLSWANVGVGTYTVTAIAADNVGAASSSAATITVRDPGPSRVTSIVVSPSPIGVGQAATVTVYGTNPCGAVQVNFGDGQAPVMPVSGLPYVVNHVWYAPGTYTLTAIGHGNCSGQVSTTLVVQ